MPDLHATGPGTVSSADIAVPDHDRVLAFYSTVLTTGTRPLWRADLMNSEGTPIIGRTRYGNLYVNSGQGHMGWTMSHGSARLAADLIAGRQTAIPLDGMTVTAAMQ